MSMLLLTISLVLGLLLGIKHESNVDICFWLHIFYAWSYVVRILGELNSYIGSMTCWYRFAIENLVYSVKVL